MSDALRLRDPARLLEHRDWIRALARRLLSDESAVDDVEQETWAAVLRAGPRDEAAARPWLGRVAERFALQRLRGEGRRARREAALAGPASRAAARPAADVVAEADAHGHVVQAVLALDEPYRTTILLRYFEGLELTAVAQRMECPLETVRTRVRRAHAKLRESLEREHGPRRALLLLPLAAGRAPAAGVCVAGSSGVAAAAAAAVGVGTIAVGAWTLGFVGGGGAGNVALQGAPLPPPVAPRQQDAPRDEEHAAWVVRDLADGSAVAGVELRVRRRGADGTASEVVASTDASGRVGDGRGGHLAPRAGDVVVAADPAWHVALPKEGVAEGESVLWLYRTATARIAVRGAGGTPHPGEAELGLGAGVYLSDPQGRGDVPAESGWYLRHGIDVAGWTRRNEGARPRLRSDGTYEFEAPVLRGLDVGVRARGHLGEVVRLAVTGDHEFAPAEVLLRPAPWIRGRLAGTQADVAGAPVQLTVHAERPARATSWAHAHAAGAGTGGTRLDPSTWSFDSMARATTDASGGFEVQAPAAGRAILWTLRPGWRPVRHEVGEVGDDVDGIELTAAAAPGTTVRFLVGGEPAADRVFTAQWRGSGVSGFTLRTDADGRARTDWFVEGATFDFLDRTPEGTPAFRELVWTGQQEVRWDELPLSRRGGVSMHGSWELPRP